MKKVFFSHIIKGSYGVKERGLYGEDDLKRLQKKFYDLCDVAVNKRWHHALSVNMQYRRESEKPYSVTHIENDSTMLYRIYSKFEKDKYYEEILIRVTG